MTASPSAGTVDPSQPRGLLWGAVWDEDTDAGRAFLEAGADPTRSGSASENLLCIATHIQADELIHLLLDAGACPLKHNSWCIAIAAKEGRADLCQRLFDLGAGRYLHRAITRPHMSTTRWLLANGPRPDSLAPHLAAGVLRMAEPFDSEMVMRLYVAAGRHATASELAEQALASGNVDLANSFHAMASSSSTSDRLASRSISPRP